MTRREELARKLCEHQGVDPDRWSFGLGKLMPEGQRFQLWECWAIHYIDVLEDDLNLH